MRRLFGVLTALAVAFVLVLPAVAHHKPDHGGGQGGGGGETTTTTTLATTTTTQATTTTTAPPPVDSYKWGQNPLVYYDIDADPVTFENAVASGTCPFNNILSEPGLEISGVPYSGLADMSELGDPINMDPAFGDLGHVPEGAIWVTARDLGVDGPLAEMVKDPLGEVVHGLIVFNINPDKDWDVSGSGQLAPCGTSHILPDNHFDLQGVITHELGHVVAGIDDLCSDSSECIINTTLYPPASCADADSLDTQAGYTMCTPWWRSDGNDAASRRYFSAEEQQWILDKYTPAGSDYEDAVLGDGPVAYWRLGESSGTTAVDSTGNGHDGSYEGGVAQGVDGLLANDPDRAAEFDDVSDAGVQIPIHADLKFLDADYSLELWFHPTGTTGGTTDRLLCWDRDWWSIAIEDAGVEDLTIYAFRDETQRANASGLTRDATYHVVYTYDASTNLISLYVNGSLIDTGASGATLPDSSSTIDIAKEPGIGTTPNAVIDEVAIYDYVLTSAQISEHYAIGSGT